MTIVSVFDDSYQDREEELDQQFFIYVVVL
jgi:hypothetical protein